MEKQEEAFRELKERFTKELMLVAPDLDKRNEDRSICIGLCNRRSIMYRVLCIKYNDKRWRPVVFLSKSLNEIKRNYEIYNKEMLAIIRGLENWRHLLEGIRFKFKIWTDYKNLEYFMRVYKLNRKQACCILYLCRFHFTLKHVPGIKH